MPDLLLELFSEEIPARMQKRASEDLKKLVTNGMVEAGITYESAAAFATPRRLCLTVTGVLGESLPLREERKGPRVDAPEKALDGFLRATGLSKDQLEVRADKKGDVYFAVIEKPGRKAGDVIAEVVEATIRNFPWSTSMRWGTGSLKWVRPLHSILCILTDDAGAEVVPFEVDGIVAGNMTDGHRFMRAGPFAVSSYDDYEAKLKAAKVVLDPTERADHIWEDAKNMTFAQGLEVVEDRGLLAEVAGLVEWPVVLMGDIAEDFFGLPPEVLQTSMKEHQKFFSVRNPKTGRIEKFITVANRETADNGATILAGNQKVLFARLSDAKFFWENDLRTIDRIGMEGMAKPLENVTFHNKLGSEAERVARIAALAREIAPLVGADPELAEQAAKVVKADLTSEMVYEFPDLQGLMGRYYATHAKLPAEVAEACETHRSPLGPSDDVPSSPVSVAVALADKIDTLTGFWSIDEKPTGSRDPFALRRAALGVNRMRLQDGRIPIVTLIESAFDRQPLKGRLNELKRDCERRLEELETKLADSNAQWSLLGGTEDEAVREVTQLVEQVGKVDLLIAEYPSWRTRTISDLIAFLFDRLKVHLRDGGIRHDILDACLEIPSKDDLTLLVKRVTALQDFVKTDDGTNLLQGYKRANNILSAEEKKDGVAYEGTPDVKFAAEDVERNLFAALDASGGAISTAIEAEDFAAAMAALANLRAPIDAFFEGVQVNSDNSIVRRNRLCLLNRIREVMQTVAIFSAIEG